MEKQAKIVKAIRRNNEQCSDSMSVNLGTKKNDECYTSMQDILNELKYWANLDKFKDKRIICPCDWDVTNNTDIYGIEINYKEDPVEVNAFKAVKSVKITKVVEYPGTLFETISETKEESVETKLVEYELKEDEIEEFLRDKLTCNFVRTLTQNARRWGIKSITASGYNPATGRGIKFQDIDYSKYDVCITNPPFSLYSEFLTTIVNRVDFILLAPFMKRANPCYGVYLMTKQAYIGFGSQLSLTFDNPTVDNKYNTKLVACDWLVSYNEAQLAREAKHFKSGIKYTMYQDDYMEMVNMTMKDGTHPIRVPSDKFPDDFTGWMFTAINVIVRLDETYEWYGTHFTGYFNKEHPEESPFAHKCSDYMLRVPGLDKTPFAGVVFRKKPQQEEQQDGTND